MPNDKKDDVAVGVYWDDIRLAPNRAQPDANAPVFSYEIGAGDMVIGTSRDRLLVVIRPNGELVFGPEYNPSEAATIFWEHMGQRRLQMEDRLLVIQHMEAILVRLGRADMDCERLRKIAAETEEPIRKAEAEQQAEIAMRYLEMIANQAIELGRALVRRPEIPTPAVPIQVPTSVQQNPNSDYRGADALPPEDPEDS